MKMDRRPLTEEDVLGIAILLVKVEGTNYNAGDRVVILDKAQVSAEGKQGWWIEKVGEADITAVAEEELQLVWKPTKSL